MAKEPEPIPVPKPSKDKPLGPNEGWPKPVEVRCSRCGGVLPNCNCK